MATGGVSNLTAEQNLLSWATALVISQPSPVTDVNRCNTLTNIKLGGTAGVVVDATHVSSVAFTPYLEPLVLISSSTVAAGNSISYQINLSAFKDTILEFKLQSSLKY